MAAREVEGDDEDEDMAGVENISMQRAEGGGGTTGGIKKGKRRRGNRKGHGLAMAIDSGWRLGGLTYDRRPMKRAGVELWTA